MATVSKPFLTTRSQLTPSIPLAPHNSAMANGTTSTTQPHHDVALWQVHRTEEDCDLIIRTNNGFAFYCQISPAPFQRSPELLKQYFVCLDLLRSGEEEIDDFYVEDACD